MAWPFNQEDEESLFSAFYEAPGDKTLVSRAARRPDEPESEETEETEAAEQRPRHSIGPDDGTGIRRPITRGMVENERAEKAIGSLIEKFIPRIGNLGPDGVAEEVFMALAGGRKPRASWHSDQELMNSIGRKINERVLTSTNQNLKQRATSAEARNLLKDNAYKKEIIKFEIERDEAKTYADRIRMNIGEQGGKATPQQVERLKYWDRIIREREASIQRFQDAIEMKDIRKAGHPGQLRPPR